MAQQTDGGGERPLLPRDRILIAIGTNVDEELECADDYGVGAEVQTFSFPGVLATDFAPLLERVAARTQETKGIVGCHGAFIDTCHFSADPEIRKVSRMRYLQSMEIAERVGAGFVVFHSQYNPIVKVADYPGLYHAGSLEFWPEVLEEAGRRNLRIYVENMFDASPEPIRRLLDAIGHPGFKACLDIAHAAIFSEVDLAEWVGVLQPHLRHVHMNDCGGEFDDHLSLGEGALDLPRAFELLRQSGQPLTYTLETDKNAAASFRFLGIDKAS